jgi:hypothetical protein
MHRDQQDPFPAMLAVLIIAVGRSLEYLLREVATGRENDYTGAVAKSEPPGL